MGEKEEKAFFRGMEALDPAGKSVFAREFVQQLKLKNSQLKVEMMDEIKRGHSFKSDAYNADAIF